MSEWIGARYKYPGTFRDAGENIPFDVDFWMAMPSGMIVSTTIIDPRQPVTFATRSGKRFNRSTRRCG